MTVPFVHSSVNSVSYFQTSFCFWWRWFSRDHGRRLKWEVWTWYGGEVCVKVALKVIRHWKNCLGRMCNLCSWRCSKLDWRERETTLSEFSGDPVLSRDWTGWPSELLSNLNCSVILCADQRMSKRKLRSPVSSCKIVSLRSPKNFLKGPENFVLCSTFFCGTVVD